MLAKSFVALVFFASTAVAAPYEGEWAAAGLSCDQAIVLGASSLQGAENICHFDEIVANRDGLFNVLATCRGEGLPAEVWTFSIMLDGPDALVIQHEGDEPISYRRC